MPTPLQEFRQSYPQYNELDDEQLADALHQKYYSDVPADKFRTLVGIRPPEPEPDPTIADRVDQKLSTTNPDPLQEEDQESGLNKLLSSPVGEAVSRFPFHTFPKDSFLGNSTRLAQERASNLLGHAVRGIVGNPGDAMEGLMPMGNIVFGSDWGDEDPADGKFRVRYMRPDEMAKLQQQQSVSNVFSDTIPNALTGVDLADDRTSPDQIKDAFERGEIMGTIGEVLAFGMEQGIKSVPDMLATMSGLPGLATYVAARSDEIGQTRAENKGMSQGGMREQLEALPFAMGSALFEKYGAEKIVGAFGKVTPDELGAELLLSGIKESLKRVGKKTGAAAGVEAGTEAFQEGVIEYLGEKLGTDAPMSWGEAVERGFFGALAGGTFGGMAGGGLATANEAVRPRDLSHLIDNEGLKIPEGQFEPEAEAEPEAATEPEAAPEPQTPYQPEPVPEPQPEPEVSDPRETLPDDRGAGTSPDYFDARLKRDVFRANVARMADELVEGGGGGVSFVRDDNDVIVGRTPSESPPWFQSMSQEPDFSMSVRQVRRAVEKALTGQPMGVRQARVVEYMLESVVDARVDPDNISFVREQLEAARESRRRARSQAASDMNEALPPLNDFDQEHAGELFEEAEYLPEMDGESRIAYELTAELDERGLGNRVDQILKDSPTTTDAITQLEKLRHEQQTTETDPQTQADQEGAGQQAEATQATTTEELGNLLALTEDQFIQAVNPEGKRLAEDDQVLLNAGDLSTPDSAQPAGSFTDSTDNLVELQTDAEGNLYALQNDQVLAFIGPTDQGETVIDVVQEAQGRGIGAQLTAEYLRRNPGSKAGGFSEGGEATYRAAYRLLQSDGVLETQTEETFRLQAEADRQRQAEAQAQEVRAAADEQLGDFTLTGSNRAADEAAARGQGNIFDSRVPPQNERRQDTARRERIAKMSPEQIMEELYTDPLTGIGNERAFNEDLPAAAAVASIDVDGLGGVNDNLGHDAGDALLKAVGLALSKTGAEVYRKSGDEFYILGDNEHDLAAVVKRVEKDLASQALETDNGKLQGISLTAGVGATKNEADSIMEASKRQREAAGKRNPKGQLPPGGVLYASRPLNMAAGSNYVGLIGKFGELPLTPNHEYQLGNGNTVRIPAKPVRRKQIMQLLERKFGNKIYQGRVKGPRSRLGFYRRGIGEIRIRNANDLEVTAHEVSHWLDDRHPWIQRLYKQFPKEMAGVSYDEKLDFEGYAEFMRLWMIQEHEARQAAPGFYDAWMAELEKHPELKGTVFELQELMHAWYLQGARARLQDRMGKQDVSLRDRFNNAKGHVADYTLQNVFDELRSFKRASRAVTGEQGKGYNTLRLARGAHGVMQAVFYRGTLNYNEDGDLDWTGKGLKKIFDPVSDRMENMQLYMMARRGQELMQQGRENLIRPDEIAYGLQLGKQDPQLAEVFDEWLAFNTRMMDFYESSGLLNATSRAAIEEMNKNYVPFNRIVDTFNGEKVKAGGSPFMRLKGGTQNINDVFDNIIGNTSRMVHMALINDGKRNFYRMIDSADNQSAAMFAVPIAKDTKPTQVESDQVIRAVVESLGRDMRWYRAAKTGMVAEEADIDLVATIDQMAEGLEPMVTFFQFGQDPTGNVDFYYEDGKKKFYEIGDKLLWDSIMHLGPKSFNMVAHMLGGFSNALRRGVTLTPTFQASNIIRDTVNAFTLSKGETVPLFGASKALMERLYNNEHYWEYMANGGGFASMADADGINRDRVLDSANSVLRAFDRGLSAFEYANRIAEYKALREKGWSKRDAALAGREISSDFGMRGSSDTLRWITLSVPFFNARLQGLYRNGRELGSMEEGQMQFAGKQAASYALRSLMAVTLPSIALYLLNKDDERYQEMPDWIKDLGWVYFTGEGEDDYVIVPKPFETGMIWGTLPERTLEYMYEHDEKELADAIGWMVLQTFGFEFVPQAYNPLRELQMNKNWTGAPIIPEYLQDVEPMEQYRSYTSDAMIALGRKLNISPIKAEHLVKGYMGTWGSYALGMSDYLVGDVTNSGAEPTKGWKDNILVSRFVNDGPLRRTKSEEEFYELLIQSREVANTVRQITNRSPERIEGYVSQAKKQVMMGLNQDLERAAAEMREIKNAMDMIENDPGLSADEKRETIFELQREVNSLARAIRQNIDPEFVQQLTDEAEAAEIASRGNQ